MTLVKYTPRLPVASLYDDMNRLFNQLWFPAFGRGTEARSTWTPGFDVRETKDQVVFEADIPGIARKDLDVTLQDGVLTISGERKERKATDDETLHRSELRYGRFVQSFTLPGEVDENKVDARYDKGTLTIKLNKLTPVQPDRKQIAIK